MAIAQAQFTSQESKTADNEVEIGLLLPLNRRNRRLLMQDKHKENRERSFERVSLTIL